MKIEREHQAAENLTSQNLAAASTVDLPEEEDFLKLQIRSAKQKRSLFVVTSCPRHEVPTSSSI
jgi:hypothetical protein